MQESRNWFKYLKWCLIVLAGLGVLLMAAVWGFRYYVRRGMTAAELAEMEKFFSEPVEIPEEWSRIEPFPEDVVLAAERLRALCTEPGGAQAVTSWRETLERLGRGEDLEPAEWEQIEESLQSRDEYLDALIELVSLPSYEMDAFPGWTFVAPSAEEKGYSRIDQIIVGHRYLLLRAAKLGKSGEHEEAFDTCIATINLLRCHPATTTLNRMIALSGQRQTFEIMLQLASGCQDAATIEPLLGELNKRAEDRSRDPGDFSVLDRVGMLRDYAREGETVDLSSGQTRAEIQEQLSRILERRTGGHMPDTDTPLFGASFAVFLYRYCTRAGDMSNITAKHDWTESLPEFDLARLALASRILELRTGAKPTGMDELVPDYFPEPLIDPFTNKPYLMSDRWGTFFSVGVNGKPEVDSMVLDGEGGLVGGDDTIIIPGQGIVTGHFPRRPRTRPRRR